MWFFKMEKCGFNLNKPIASIARCSKDVDWWVKTVTHTFFYLMEIRFAACNAVAGASSGVQCLKKLAGLRPCM